MVKAYKLHKFFGLSAGLVIFILGITGFLLNHDKWGFLYTTSFENLPLSAYKSDTKLFTSYMIDPINQAHIIVGSKRGIFESFDKAKTFKKTISFQSLAIRSYNKEIYSATSEGIFIYTSGKWKNFALKNQYVTSLAIDKDKIAAVIDKKYLVILDKKSANILNIVGVNIEKSQLQEDIKLSRFVRDLHYGRGLFDGDISLFINDYAALVMTFLAFSGFLIWYMIKVKKYVKSVKKLIKYHANIFILFAFIPIFILSITGVFLDHANILSKFMSSIKLPHKILPSVYNTLQSDIWSLDIHNNIVRIGNRYGIYKSDNLKQWKLESRGFAYKMIRENNLLYVSGMGASNKVFDGKWNLLRNSPHMFKDILHVDKKLKYFSSSTTLITKFKLPKFTDATLYSLLLTLHDGTFFSSWWIWINDLVVFSLIILFLSGFIRYYKKLTLN